MDPLQPAGPDVLFQAVLQRPGLHPRLRPGEDVGGGIPGLHPPAQRRGGVGQGDDPQRRLAFRGAGDDPGAALLGVPEPLQRGGDAEGPIL